MCQSLGSSKMNEIEDLRTRLKEIMVANPGSLRQYTVMIGFNKTGSGTTLKRFLDGNSPPDTRTVLRVQKFVEEYERTKNR